MGASEGFKSLCGHSLNSTLPLFSFHLRVLKDSYEFEYRLDHLCHVALVYVFHLMSLTCFLPRAFIFFSWLGTSFHFVVTCLMFWDMFIDHIFTPYIYHGPSTPFFVFSTQCSYCHYGKVKDIFTLFSRELP